MMPVMSAFFIGSRCQEPGESAGAAAGLGAAAGGEGCDDAGDARGTVIVAEERLGARGRRLRGATPGPRRGGAAESTSDATSPGWTCQPQR